MEQKNVLALLKSHRAYFLQKYPLETLALFGSFARGEATQSSDVDILYMLRSGASMDFDMYLEFEAELKKLLGKEIDLVNAKKLNPLVKLHTQSEMVYV